METMQRDEIRTCSVETLRSRLGDGNATVVDVREYPEYADAHVAGSRLVPLTLLRVRPEVAGSAGETYLLCQTGRRAREAAAILQAAGQCEPVVVEGGMEAWKRAGYPVQREKGPISLMRQVQIAAGSLILAGLLVPGLGFLPYVVGAGLVFAGLTGSCAMGLLMARLPWNRPKTAAAAGVR
jgi:rhodanese-related sulfurtransferase